MFSCHSSKEVKNEKYPAVYPISIDDKWGLTNETGTLYCDLTFDSINLFKYELALAKKGGKFGYIDQSGNWIIKPQFQHAEDFYYDCAKVKVDDKEYYINRKGKKIKFSNCRASKLVPSHYRGSKFETTFEINQFVIEKGKKFAIKYEEVNDTTDFVYDSVKPFNRTFFIVERAAKFGFFFRPIPRVYNGKVYIKDTIERYDYDEILVTEPSINPYSGLYHHLAHFHSYRIGELWGIIHDNQGRITPPKYHSIAINNSNDFFWVEYQPNKFGYVNKDGDELFKN